MSDSLLEVGDYGLAPLERRLDAEPLERTELREAVLADRPARVEEPPPLTLPHERGLELLGEEVDETVRRSVLDPAPERELVLRTRRARPSRRRARCGR